MDATLVIYTGLSLSHIPVSPNTDLQTILSSIDTKFNTTSAAPDYSGYNLYCVKQVDGTTHPTNTQNFAEGISKALCDFKTTYTSFTTVTYAAAISDLSDATNALTSPALTYVPFSITSADSFTTVWTKTFTGLTAISGAQNPSSASWGTLSITPPTTITGGFNSVITYLSTLTTTVSGKQAAISNFDNSTNCLSGTSSDTIRATVDLLRTRVCSLPTFVAGSITFGGVSSASDLQGSVQNVVSTASSILQNAVVAQGTGLSISAVGTTYQGKKLAVDPTWTGLAKVAVDVSDTGGYLEDKIESSDSSLTITNTGSTLDITLTTPVASDHKVKINSTDASAGYLQDKIIPMASSWGLGTSIIPSSDNSRVSIAANVTNPNLFINNIFNQISTDPDLLATFCSIANQCIIGPVCDAVSNLVVTRATNDIQLDWTVAGSPVSQMSKYRQRGDTLWQANNFTVPNPLSNIAVTNTSQVSTKLNNNTVYQYQIDSICASGLSNGNISEMVVYATQSTTTNVVSGVINITQNPLATINTIYYRLKNAGHSIIQSTSATGVSPSASFTAVASGNYTVEWRYETLINGSNLASDDASQSAVWYTTGTVVVP